MAYVTIHKRRVYYEAHGRPTPTSPTLLLIHGAGRTHVAWPAELRHLPQAAVYALDLPGHGRSDGPGRTAVGDYADVVLAFIEALDLQRAVVVGHSMGGAIAQTIGLRHHPAVRGLVLVGTGARLRVAPAILGPILVNFETAVQTITSNEWGPQAPAGLIEEGRVALLQVAPVVLHGDYTACNAFDVMGQLERIALPTLVLAGTADKMTPPKFGQFLAEHIAGAHLVTLEGAGHNMMLEQPGAVAKAIGEFLREIENGD
ncbi:MAG: alpha/beta fold hydrolase [Chloroflexota bacterium]